MSSCRRLATTAKVEQNHADDQAGEVLTARRDKGEGQGDDDRAGRRDLVASIHTVDRNGDFDRWGYRPLKTAARRSMNDWMPSFMSSLFITRSRIFGMIPIAGFSPASINLRAACFVICMPSGAFLAMS